MLFREVKQGFPLYVLNINTMDIGTGTVSRVTGPHVTNDKKKLANGQFMMVVDVTANMGNNSLNFELQDSVSQTMSDDGQFLISPNQEDIANGVRMIRTRCEEYIRNAPRYKELIGKCDSWLQENDPVYQQNAAFEKKLEDMQSIIDKQNKVISQQAADTKEMKEMLTKILKTK